MIRNIQFVDSLLELQTVLVLLPLMRVQMKHFYLTVKQTIHYLFLLLVVEQENRVISLVSLVKLVVVDHQLLLLQMQLSWEVQQK